MAKLQKENSKHSLISLFYGKRGVLISFPIVNFPFLWGRSIWPHLIITLISFVLPIPTNL
jgi:hypothetical protein